MTTIKAFVYIVFKPPRKLYPRNSDMRFWCFCFRRAPVSALCAGRAAYGRFNTPLDTPIVKCGMLTILTARKKAWKSLGYFFRSIGWSLEGVPNWNEPSSVSMSQLPHFHYKIQNVRNEHFQLKINQLISNTSSDSKYYNSKWNLVCRKIFWRTIFRFNPPKNWTILCMQLSQILIWNIGIFPQFLQLISHCPF
jgi:hypothetical protein